MKVLHEYQRFWRRIFEYFAETGTEAYSFFWYVVLTPSVRFNESTKFKKFFSKFAVEVQIDPAVPKYVVYLIYVIRLAHLWTQHKFWPTRNEEGLELLYNAIMHDYRTAQPCTFEEALADPGNMAESNMLKRSWFIIDSALRNTNHEQVRQIIEKSIQEEREQSVEETKQAHILFTSYELDENFRKLVDTIIKDDLTNEVSDAQLAQHLTATVQDNQLMIPLKYAKLLYAALCVFRDHRILEEKFQQKIETLYAAMRELQEFYAGQIKLLVDEAESLKAQLQQMKTVKVEKVHVGHDAIKILRASYEAEIARLEEQIRMLKEQLSEQIKPKVEEHALVPFQKPIYIAYFGLKNANLEDMLAQYNVFVKLYTPLEPPRMVPDLPIVFNIDVAVHDVWNHIKTKKPLLVSGSNGKLLAQRIVEWLHKIQP